jgi:imidazolonepropionase
MDSLLITHASQLLTLAGPARARIGDELGDLRILQDGAALIENGLIVAVGPSDEIKAPHAQTIDASGSVVMPGFIDAHTHPVFAGDRADEFELRLHGLTYQEIARRGGGIRSTVGKTRAASEAELLDAGRRYARWFIEHGTTTIEAKSGYGLSIEDELKLLRVIRKLGEEGPLEIVPTVLAAHVLPEEFAHDRAEYIRLISDGLLPRVAQEGLAEYHDVFCDEGAFTLSETRTLMSAARAHGLKLRIHAEQLSRSEAAQLAAELQMKTADHLEKVRDEDIAALAQAGVMAVLLPGAIFNLGLHDYPPARKLIAAGVPVVLATDFNPGTSPTPNMQMILSLACTQMRMTPAEAISAATINAAYSLDRGDRLGSLEPGKQADLIILDCADYRQIPYFFGINHVRIVIKRGQIVFYR